MPVELGPSEGADARPRSAAAAGLPTLLLWDAPDRASLRALLSRDALPSNLGEAFRGPDRVFRVASGGGTAAGLRLAVVARNPDELATKLERARSAVADPSRKSWEDPEGIAFQDRPPFLGAKVAFVFPGQGAQAVGMLRELHDSFPALRHTMDAFDEALGGELRPRIYPPEAGSDEERERQREALRSTEIAQPALGAASLGLARVLEQFGVRPDVVAGYSYGELVALTAAGVFAPEALAVLSRERGRAVIAAAGDQPGAMAVVIAGPDAVRPLLEGHADASLVHWNGPSQTVISGTRPGVAAALARARERGISARPLPMACAFHSPLIGAASRPVADLAARLGPRAPALPVYSNVTATPYPADPRAIAEQVGEHLVEPVLFAPMIEAMARDGVRVFIEAGPGWIVSSLVRSILADRPHLVAPCDPPERPGLEGLLQTLGRLACAGVSLDLPAWPPRRAEAAPAPESRPAVGVEDDPTLGEFHRTMRMFLDIQREVMRDYLAARPDRHPADDAEARGRHTLELVPAPLPRPRRGIRERGVILLTDDGRGVARATAAELRAGRFAPVLIRPGRGGPARGESDLTSPAAVRDLLHQVRPQGPIAAVIDCAPLGGLVHSPLDRLGLFQLLLGAADDLRESAGQGGSAIICPSTAVGPAPWRSARGCRALLGAPLAAAWLADLAPMLPGVRLRAVDMDGDEDAEVLAAGLIHELFADDDGLIVCYDRGERLAIRPGGPRDPGPPP
jgi:acyl transferase domain-containing protein